MPVYDHWEAWDEPRRDEDIHPEEVSLRPVGAVATLGALALVGGPPASAAGAVVLTMGWLAEKAVQAWRGGQ